MSDQINVNEIANALQTKVDLDMGNLPQSIDFVVGYQLPTASNNYTWYRLYRSGWCEQGGVVSSSMGQYGQEHSLVIPFENTSYSIYVTLNQFAGSWSAEAMSRAVQTSTSTFSIQCGGNGANPGNMSWYACGMAAQS